MSSRNNHRRSYDHNPIKLRQAMDPQVWAEGASNSSHSSIPIPWAMDIIRQHAKDSNLRKWSKVTFKKPDKFVALSEGGKKKPLKQTQHRPLTIAEQSPNQPKSISNDVGGPTQNIVKFRIPESKLQGDKPQGSHGFSELGPNDEERSQPILTTTDLREAAKRKQQPLKKPDKRHIASNPQTVNAFDTVPVAPQIPEKGPKGQGHPSKCGHGSCQERESGPTRGHHFTVTYWFFYPYNRGKDVCTSKVWLFGRVAKPLFKGQCLGQNLVMGNHVGDWEHVSLFFEVRQDHLTSKINEKANTM